MRKHTCLVTGPANHRATGSDLGQIQIQIRRQFGSVRQDTIGSDTNQGPRKSMRSSFTSFAASIGMKCPVSRMTRRAFGIDRTISSPTEGG